MQRITGKLVFAGMLIAAVAALGARAAATEHKKVEVPSEGAKQLEVEIDLGAGILDIVPESMGPAAVFDVTYDERRVDCSVDYRLHGSTMRLTAESDYHNEGKSIDTDDNDWQIRLSKGIPVSLSIDIGACEAEIDLGGLQLTDLSMDVGATETEITFSEPNKSEMEELRFEAGASSVRATKLGNANFRLCTFEGGAGSFDLDFTGQYRGESEIELNVGMGSADITLPAGVPCRIEGADGGFLSSVDVHGGDLDRISDDVYESPDFDEATTRIILRVDMGVSSVDIRFE